MEQELQPYLDSKGHLTVGQRNKFLASKKAVRLNEQGNISAIIYEGTYEAPTFIYTQIDRDIDKALKNIKYKKVGTMGVIEQKNDNQTETPF